MGYEDGPLKIARKFTIAFLVTYLQQLKICWTDTLNGSDVLTAPPKKKVKIEHDTKTSDSKTNDPKARADDLKTDVKIKAEDQDTDKPELRLKDVPKNPPMLLLEVEGHLVCCSNPWLGLRTV